MAKIGKLYIVRHHESEWNKLGLWTGSRDIGLTPYGFEMSQKMGELLKNYCESQLAEGALVDRNACHFDHVFISTQLRTLETYQSLMQGLGISGSQLASIPLDRSAALNERDYGDWTGKNKWKVKEEIGDEAFEELRRGWNTAVPHGESLSMVYDRAVPYYTDTILPMLKDSKDVLIVSSGNAIRCLIKYIENISDANIIHIEMPFGAILLYNVDATGHMLTKDLIGVESEVNA